ncbi:dipeptide ABC transporter ATP-binding protein [Nordella sp. HKS 07]|uniref:ABC transporter ATP-binding protein n=1 Tax=Nordella sp. HKS 07 TaxID=2712222 RepID=UPI0013E1C772|nr:dipeptide ABC transporter ATP-binding protein [Nordella sp. HKS 07]QIG46628.1 dipeptide ABC transporter ATP-binding protein [Nordella sp. HKS 07]
MTAPLLEVTDLSKSFPLRGGWPWRKHPVSAVDGLAFTLQAGETLSLVGESGCGKSTTGRMLAGLTTPSAGRILVEGRDIATFSKSDRNGLRRKLQFVFQDPYGSLNPRMTAGELIAEPALLHGLADRASARSLVAELLGKVGLSPSHADRYPHQFSGGQRQRLGIARALAVKPQVIICDEPVSALDVSVQAQIVNLLQDLQSQFGLSYLFISHGLSVVRHISHRVAVMYLGRIVEIGSKEQIFGGARHPYTQALLASAPVPRPGHERIRVALKGDVPSPLDPPSGCRFHTRCPFAIPRCRTDVPALTATDAGAEVACHRLSEITPASASDAALAHAPRTHRLLSLYRQAAAAKSARI